MNKTKKITSLVLAVMMVVSMLVVGTVAASAAAVAKIGETEYSTLVEALNAADDGDTVTVLADCGGDGWVAPQGRFNNTGLTVDFGGHTYTVSGTPVGSSGTETNGFQLLKGNKITFKNGAIYGDSYANRDLMRMIQNYSDLTLDKMTVSMKGLYYDQITVSTCNGNTVIKDSTISEPDFSWAGYQGASVLRGAAITMGTFASYESIGVTVTNSTINGDFKVTDENSKDNFSLNFESGTLNGDIILDDNAQAAVDNAPATATVTKKDAVVQNVAKIGNVGYTTLVAALNAATDGDTVTVLADCDGAGWVAAQGKFNNTGLNVDFNGHTYTVSGTPVGSSGTETIGFQLLKENKITFKNGTIFGDCHTNANLMRMIQNYSDLTLSNMTVSMNGQYYDQITVSTCNGKTVINNSTINAPDYSWINPSYTDSSRFGGAAITMGTFSSYESIDVTVKGTSTINGDFKVDNENRKDNFSLDLQSGTLNGDIILSDTAKEGIAAKPDNAKVTKEATFSQDAPDGYIWGDGNTTLKALKDISAIDSYQQKTVNTNVSTKDEGNDIYTKGVRLITKVDQQWLNNNASEYGYIVGKYSGNKTIEQMDFTRLNTNNGAKKINCKGSENNIPGLGAGYVTLAVNGMADGEKVVARFYVVVNGTTYFANYSTYDGILATY